MRITISQLRQLISEAVEEVQHEGMEGIHEDDDGGGVDECGAAMEKYMEECDECGYSEVDALEEYMAEAKKKSMRLGGGGRFKKMVSMIKRSGKSEKSAKAIAAAAGRKKYGAKKMAKMAAAGRRRSLKK